MNKKQREKGKRKDIKNRTRPDTRPIPVADGWAGAEMRVFTLSISIKNVKTEKKKNVKKRIGKQGQVGQKVGHFVDEVSHLSFPKIPPEQTINRRVDIKL